MVYLRLTQSKMVLLQLLGLTERACDWYDRRYLFALA